MKGIFDLILKPVIKFVGIIDLVLRNVFRRRIRTFLTSGAITIGVFLIVVVFSLGLGVNKWLVDEISTQTDMRLVTVLPPSLVQKSFLGWFTPEGKKSKEIVLSEGMIEELKKIPNVESVTPILALTVDKVVVEGEENPIYFPTVSAMSIVRGTPYIKDVLAGEPEVLDNQSDGVVATTFFLRRLGIVEGPYDRWIGKKMRLTIPIRVAPTGILYTTVESKEIQCVVVGIVDIGLGNSDLFVNFDTATAFLTESAEMSKDDFLRKIGYYAAIVRVNDASNTENVATIIEKLGLISQTPKDYIKLINNMFKTVQLSLSAFGFVSLIVAGLGIANTMIMAIYERTKEIGIMKAIGASRWTIRTLLLTEAGLIGLFGGLVGVLLGYGATRVGSAVILKILHDQGIFMNRLFFYPLWLGISATVFSCLIGVLAGVYPAQKAASLDPVEAMRYE